MLWRLGLSLGLIGLIGCGSSADETPAGTHYSGIVPAALCAPGSMPRVGNPDCVPVGTTHCAPGFTLPASGWGCEAVIPDGCGAAERAVLGGTSCTPVDDCAAAFPPPGAFAVVSDSTSLATALGQAPPGSTIALDAGEYGPVTLTKNVSLVGRCAKDVVFRGPGVRGIFMQAGLTVSLSSLTVDGFDGGVVASYGPNVTLSKLILSNNLIGLLVGEATASIEQSLIVGPAAFTPSDLSGGIVGMIGAKITASELELRDDRSGIGAYDENTQITVKRSVLSYVGPVETARLVSAYTGADVLIEESALSTRAGGLIAVGRELGVPSNTPPPPAHVRIASSVLSQTGDNRAKGLIGVSDEAALELENSTVHHQSYYAFLVGDGAKLALASSAITTDPTWDVFRGALFVTNAGSAELGSVAVISAYQNALLAAHPGTRLTLRDSLVAGTEFRGPGPNAELGGSGLALGVGDNADLVLERSSVVDSRQFSIYAERQARVQLADTLVDRSLKTADGNFGNGLVVGETARLAMQSSMVRDSEDAALAVSGGTGKIEGSVFLTNGVVVHLDRALLLEESAKPEPDSGEVLFRQNQLFENGSFTRDGPFIFVPAGIE